MAKTALVTGAGGQDGSLLCEYLLYKGYSVDAALRRAATSNTANLDHLRGRAGFNLVALDLSDPISIKQLDIKNKYQEVYNLGAQSHVHESWSQPEFTYRTNFIGVHALLEEIAGTDVKMYQASTSEMFGAVSGLQTESTPLNPNSPYAIAKTAAHQLCKAYRIGKAARVWCGILFNHEHYRRGQNFVTQKICRQVNEIKQGKRDFVELGNLDAMRDWGWAPEYVVGMHAMLQTDVPDDYILATGKVYSVGSFLQYAWETIGLKGEARAESKMEFIRPMEVPYLRGSSEKARKAFGWHAYLHTPLIAGLMTRFYGEPLMSADWEEEEGNVLHKEAVSERT